MVAGVVDHGSNCAGAESVFPRKNDAFGFAVRLQFHEADLNAADVRDVSVERVHASQRLKRIPAYPNPMRSRRVPASGSITAPSPAAASFGGKRGQRFSKNAL